jgi:hypothetical protein
LRSHQNLKSEIDVVHNNYLKGLVSSKLSIYGKHMIILEIGRDPYAAENVICLAEPRSPMSVVPSVAAVRFGPVQRPIFPNPGLDLGFGSAKLSNLGLDLRFKFSEVRFRFRGGSDRFEPIFVSHGPNHLKKCLQHEFTTEETTHPQYTRVYPLPKECWPLLIFCGYDIQVLRTSFN